jgi:hypothetical protein
MLRLRNGFDPETPNPETPKERTKHLVTDCLTYCNQALTLSTTPLSQVLKMAAFLRQALPECQRRSAKSLGTIGNHICRTWLQQHKTPGYRLPHFLHLPRWVWLDSRTTAQALF